MDWLIETTTQSSSGQSFGVPMPRSGRYLLYSIVHEKAATVSPETWKIFCDRKDDLDRELRFLDDLFGRNRRAQELNSIEVDGAPCDLTVLPSLECNLRCVYCYSDAGERTLGRRVSLSAVKTCLEIVAKNAKRKGRRFSVGFHGGGEPLLAPNLKLINEALDYSTVLSKRLGVDFSASCTTNGVSPINRIKQTLGRMAHVTLSMDGPPEIHDIQRPFANGRKSSKQALSTLAFLREAKIDTSARITVSRESTKLMPEMVRYFSEIGGFSSIHFEPLFSQGRGLNANKAHPPIHRDFIEKFLEATQVARELDVSVFTSAARLQKVDGFCGAVGRNFFLAPGDHITTCLEVCREEHALSEVFFVGKYAEKESKVIIDRGKIKKLASRTVANMKSCERCICRQVCGGGCLAKVGQESGSIYDAERYSQCGLTKELFVRNLLDVVSGQGRKSSVKFHET